MEDLIQQTCLPVATIRQQVEERRYSLLGPNNRVVLPEMWETVVQEDLNVVMHIWSTPDFIRHELQSVGINVLEQANTQERAERRQNGRLFGPSLSPNNAVQDTRARGPSSPVLQDDCFEAAAASRTQPNFKSMALTMAQPHSFPPPSPPPSIY